MNRRAHCAAILLIAITASSCSPAYVPEEPGHIEQPKAISTPEPAESGVEAGEDTEGLIDLTGIKSGEVPADVQEHIQFSFGGGAGFGCIGYIAQNEELSENLYVYSLPEGRAGWCFYDIDESMGEIVVASLELPDGSLYQLEAIVEYDDNIDSNFVGFEYQFNETSDRKPHRFITDLSGRHIEIRFIPVVKGYYFGGFASNEPVRVLIYEDMQLDAEFRAELYANADTAGELWVKINELFDQPPPILVIGEITGCQFKAFSQLSVMRTQIRGSTDLDCRSIIYKKP